MFTNYWLVDWWLSKTNETSKHQHQFPYRWGRVCTLLQKQSRTINGRRGPLSFSAPWLENTSCLWTCIFLSISGAEELMSVSRLFAHQSSTSNGISRSLALMHASRLFLSRSKLDVLLLCMFRLSEVSSPPFFFPLFFTGGRLGLFLYPAGS